MNHKAPPRLPSGAGPPSLPHLRSRNVDERVDGATDFQSTPRLHQILTMTIKDNIWLTEMAEFAAGMAKTAGFPPPFCRLSSDFRSAEQLEHALLRLVGEC